MACLGLSCRGCLSSGGIYRVVASVGIAQHIFLKNIYKIIWFIKQTTLYLYRKQFTKQFKKQINYGNFKD